eukprot:s1928_g6.t1
MGHNSSKADSLGHTSQQKASDRMPEAGHSETLKLRSLRKQRRTRSLEISIALKLRTLSRLTVSTLQPAAAVYVCFFWADFNRACSSFCHLLDWAMPDFNVPPGGAIFDLMAEECIQTTPKLTDVDKPPCLSTLDDSKWRSWHAELSEIVDQYWNQAIPIMISPFGFLVVVVLAGLQFAGLALPFWALPVVIIPFILLSFLAHCIIVGKNEELDQQIHELCAKLSSSTEGAVKVEYRTSWTGLCKPKRARTERLIAFVPATAVSIPGAVMLTVTVPQGLSGGVNQIPIQTPLGTQIVNIPPGLSPGQTFTVTQHQHAMPVVQAQVVEAQVANQV